MMLVDINNYFGDIDLFLMDALLKGYLPEKGRVLDLGCGEGRNAVYFISHGYEYVGVDMDVSKIRLLEYMSSTMGGYKTQFITKKIEELEIQSSYDLIICSRVLHFAENRVAFDLLWSKILEATAKGSVVYVSMDSVVDTTAFTLKANDQYEFPDGRISFSLTEQLYAEMKFGFEELEPLRTLVHHQARTQSFMMLKRN